MSIKKVVMYVEVNDDAVLKDDNYGREQIIYADGEIIAYSV